MSKSLPPAIRRQIIAFDPAAPDAPSVSEFCRAVGISRPSFYNLRQGYAVEGNAALNPRSRAPKTPARAFGGDTVEAVLKIRRRLTAKGWDAGPKSVWHAGIDGALFPGKPPSVSTIARILADAGVVDANPRKRPRKSYIRFQRAAAMEMWQLDAFTYTLCAEQRRQVTVYQLVDDSTRYDVGTCAYSRPENGDDAIMVVSAAIARHGVPQELLSDNGVAFNQLRRGSVAPLQRLLADQGCLGISGKVRSPTTQGKNERSHQTLQRFLDAHQPVTLGQVNELLTEYREYYNHRRHHQSLPGEMTPAQAWDACEHRPSDGIPIPHADLLARALAHKAQADADAAARAGADTPAQLWAEDPQHTITGRLRKASDEVVITRENPQIYLHGRILKVPTHLVGSYQLVITDTEYALFDVRDGVEAICFPLPLATTATKRTLPFWQVHGARIRDARPGWTQKHQVYEAEHHPGA